MTPKTSSHCEHPQLKAAIDVPEARLTEFYRQMYRGRETKLEKIWKWLYRSETFFNDAPLVIELDSKIVGHAGMIPFNATVNKRLIVCCWFVDFAIMDDYQRQGLGHLLTNKWMEYPDLCVTFCNNKSIGVFRKYGWTETLSMNIHYEWIQPFDHNRFHKTTSGNNLLFSWLNKLCRAIVVVAFRHGQYISKHLIDEPIDETNIQRFVNDNVKLKSTRVIRDLEYLRWRLLSSPNSKDYKVLKLHGKELVIVKSCLTKSKVRQLDVLLFSSELSGLERNTIARGVVLWAAKKGYSLVRYGTSDSSPSWPLTSSIFSRKQTPIFAYWTNDENLRTNIQIHKFDWQLIDSDFEFI